MEPPIKILIVDDDDVCRELLQEATQEEGVEVILAANGMEALKKLSSGAVDILITDLNMPRMDGLKLLAHAREIYPNILAIIITGYGSMETAIDAIRKGAYDYILKPFKIERIAVVARNAIEKVRILREKTRLLQELELAYRRLQTLETRLHPPEERHEAVKAAEAALVSSVFLFPRHSMPLSVLEAPEEASARILAKLERLQELKREKVIDEREFSALKSVIIDSLGSEKS